MLTCHKIGNPQDISLGKLLLKQGRVGCIVLAGGDGSRLGWPGPKGTFPISLIQRKTLFEMLIEKVTAASLYYECSLSCAVMTSPLNHEVTRRCFPPEIELFSQGLLPLLDENKQPLAEKRPSGNGEVWKYFSCSPIYQNWKQKGIEYIQVIPIDNPLAEPFDPNQIGIHAKTKAEITLKVVEKLHPEEAVGVIGEKEGKPCVVEYLENPPQSWHLANTGLFSFHMSFVDRVKSLSLPLHEVKKFAEGKIVYKSEYFIFDLLSYSEKTEMILYPREETFAPLKTRQDIQHVQRAMLHKDRKIFEAVTGNRCGEETIELHPEFYYPGPNFLKQWRGKSCKGYLSSKG